jgi:Ca2+-binding EF-hand superfamily protein
VDGNGYIDQDEMTKIVQSVYKMMGPGQLHLELIESPEERAEKIFKRMDINSDGRVTRKEFVQCCQQDDKLLQLLTPQPNAATNRL